MTDRLQAEQGKGDPFAAAIRATRMPMIITDPRQADNPIVFANEAFLKLTGYIRDEIVGRNCRFLQGPDSDPASVAALRQAIADRRDINVELLNYRKDGSTFWNSLYISPVSNEAGELQFFFASQLDVTEQRTSVQRHADERARFEKAVQDRTRELEAALEAQDTLLHEVDHRVKNNLQMVSSLIAMQSRTIKDETVRASLRSMLARVEALGTVHRRLYQSKDVGHFDVADFVRDLVVDLVEASGRPGLETKFDLEPVIVPAEQATPIALIVNELVTNALKHAFGDATSSRRGTLGVKMKRIDGSFQIEVYDDGPGMPSSQEETSFGTRLIRSLARQLRADIAWLNSQPGTRVAITLPVTEPLEKTGS